MRTDKAEHWRIKHPLGIEQNYGDPFGSFLIKRLGRPTFFVIASPADNVIPWDHVSISCQARCPTWEEMCWVKALFFDDEETVVQFHPPKSDYVNMAKHCLHLWKFNGEMPRPPSIAVGPK